MMQLNLMYLFQIKLVHLTLHFFSFIYRLVILKYITQIVRGRVLKKQTMNDLESNFVVLKIFLLHFFKLRIVQFC